MDEYLKKYIINHELEEKKLKKSLKIREKEIEERECF